MECTVCRQAELTRPEPADLWQAVWQRLYWGAAHLWVRRGPHGTPLQQKCVPPPRLCCLLHLPREHLQGELMPASPCHCRLTAMTPTLVLSAEMWYTGILAHCLQVQQTGSGPWGITVLCGKCVSLREKKGSFFVVCIIDHYHQ